MNIINDGKINTDGIISSGDLITEKQGYEAMLLMLKAYWDTTGSNDLTDILSGGEYWPIPNRPADSAFWEYWLEAVDKIRNGHPPLIKELT